MIPEHLLQDQINNADRQLLWDIRELLRNIDAKLGAQTSENNQGDTSTLVHDITPENGEQKRRGRKPA